MCPYVRITPIRHMTSDFFNCDYHGCKSSHNVFTNVPKFSSEFETSNYIIKSLNSSEELSGTGMTFFAHPSDHSQATICGVATALNEGQTGLIWASIELLIACRCHSVSEDPFCDLSQNGEVVTEKHREVLSEIISLVELVFKYQQRNFVFIILLTRNYGRVVRFDRSGIIASEKIDYEIDGSKLTEFIIWYTRLGAARHGHDPTASRISLTDPLCEELKVHGAAAAEMDPEDHVQRLFNQSLDEGWPWWKLEVHDKESKKAKWFAVGKPHFYAGGVAGRGTRGYVAMPLDDKGKKVDSKAAFVYLKDAWRVDHEGMEMEGTILKVLNDAKVQYVPTMLYHGCLGQSAESYDRWPDDHEGKTRETCPLKSHQHYRLVVAEVGKPLSEFENAFQLVWALFCCITAHEQACAAGYIHRDISEGNILLYKDEDGEWSGLLNDWELSKEYVNWKTQGGGRQLDRTGTWQFMSVHVLLKHTKLIEIPDDLESFFHVLLYFGQAKTDMSNRFRFLPRNLADTLVGHFLYTYFDDHSDGEPGFICGSLKYNAIKRGIIDLSTITGSGGGDEAQTEQPLLFLESHPPTTSRGDNDTTEKGNSVAAKTHPVNALVSELLKAFQAFYARDAQEVPEQAAYDDPFGIHPHVLARLKRPNRQEADPAGASGVGPASAATGHPTVDPKMAAKIESHAAILDLISNHLTRSLWPKLDKSEDKKPKGGYVPAKENTAVATGSKRGAEGGGESTSKRVRSRAA